MISRFFDQGSNVCLLILLPIAICVTFFSDPYSAPAEPTLDLIRLRDVICAHESQGERDPDDAVGKRDGSLGRCQIKPGTARLVGYHGKNHDLFGPDSQDRNKYWALMILVQCHTEHPLWGVKGIAYCFNVGFHKARRGIDPARRTPKSWTYAETRATEYEKGETR